MKSYYIETPDDVADRVRLCLKHAPAERLSFAPDCGLSQTARWAAKQKLDNMVEGVKACAEGIGGRDRAAAVRTTRSWPMSRTSRDEPARLHLWWLGQSGFLVSGRRAGTCCSTRICPIRSRRNMPPPTSRTSHDRARRSTRAAGLRATSSPPATITPTIWMPRRSTRCCGVNPKLQIVMPGGESRLCRGTAGHRARDCPSACDDRRNHPDADGFEFHRASRPPTNRSNATSRGIASISATSCSFGALDHLPQRRHRALRRHGRTPRGLSTSMSPCCRSTAGRRSAAWRAT